MNTTAITPEAVLRAIAIGAARPPEQIDLQRSFEENGLNSVDLLAILFELEEAFGVAIPNDAFVALQRNPDGRSAPLNALLPLLGELLTGSR